MGKGLLPMGFSRLVCLQPFNVRSFQCKILGCYLKQHHQHHILEPCFKQSHRARHKLIKRKDFPVRFLGTWWLLLYQQASLKWNAVLCRKWSVVKSQHLYPVWAPLKTFNDFLLCIWWKHLLWLWVSEAVHLHCCFPLEPNPFSRLTVMGGKGYCLNDTKKGSKLFARNTG